MAHILPASATARRNLRWALSFAGGAAISSLCVLSLANAQSLGGHNSNAPVDYAADRIELQDRQQRVVLSGNVDIAQGGLRLRAARTTVAYNDDGALRINRIDATGGVQVTRGDESARGDVGVYDFNRNIITLSGNVGLRRGSDTLNGGRLVIDLNTGISSVDGAGGGTGSSATPGSPVSAGPGRVSGSFSAPKRD